mmetsp:Transcript_44201/g.147451  ORF Transcript_44201/g.147451 Transcript_44201/m.147451 type:complete len:248 (+) Transcript_44201:272-1015(+)
MAISSPRARNHSTRSCGATSSDPSSPRAAASTRRASYRAAAGTRSAAAAQKARVSGRCSVLAAGKAAAAAEAEAEEAAGCGPARPFLARGLSLRGSLRRGLGASEAGLQGCPARSFGEGRQRQPAWPWRSGAGARRRRRPLPTCGTFPTAPAAPARARASTCTSGLCGSVPAGIACRARLADSRAPHRSEVEAGQACCRACSLASAASAPAWQPLGGRSACAGRWRRPSPSRARDRRAASPCPPRAT